MSSHCSASDFSGGSRYGPMPGFYPAGGARGNADFPSQTGGVGHRRGLLAPPNGPDEEVARQESDCRDRCQHPHQRPVFPVEVIQPADEIPEESPIVVTSAAHARDSNPRHETAERRTSAVTSDHSATRNRRLMSLQTAKMNAALAVTAQVSRTQAAFCQM